MSYDHAVLLGLSDARMKFRRARSAESRAKWAAAVQALAAVAPPQPEFDLTDAELLAELGVKA